MSAPADAAGKELVALEAGFWTGGAGHYEAHLAQEATMVFPDPAGTMDRAETIASVRRAGRWRAVEFPATRLLRPGRETAILVYDAVADRGDGRDRARCSSVYVREGAAWKLALHQQTPLADDGPDAA